MLLVLLWPFGVETLDFGISGRVRSGAPAAVRTATVRTLGQISLRTPVPSRVRTPMPQAAGETCIVIRDHRKMNVLRFLPPSKSIFWKGAGGRALGHIYPMPAVS